MNSNKCVIGWGTVGKATAKTFNITKYYSRSEANITLQEASKCQFIFVCLPTPTTTQGRCNTNAITELIKELILFPDFKNAVLVIRSTVYPGYSRYLQTTFRIKNIVSNPEFLSEDTWEHDATHPTLTVIGGDDAKYRELLLGEYMGRFKYSKPWLTDSITAETLKYSLNVFFATKVIFANEVFDYCQKIGANYETIKTALEAHPWGSVNHFTVFHKKGRGAGGKCLRKDLAAFAHEVNGAFFDIVHYRNEELLKESKKE